MNPPPHKYNGARSMIILHERELRSFVMTWKEAKDQFERIGHPALPETDDPSYLSYDHLVQHVLRAARGYMVWMCEKLGLPDPAIPATPAPEEIAGQVDQYLETVLSAWHTPLKDVDEEHFHTPAHLSRWKVEYCIDAMMEHAVMHPIRHRYQLEVLASKV